MPLLGFSQQGAQHEPSPRPASASMAQGPIGSASGNAGLRGLPADLPLRRDADPALTGTAGYMLWLLLVVGAIAALWFAQSRGTARPAWLMKVKPGQRHPVIKVVATASLGSGNSVQIVHWNGEELLLGCTAQSINLLGSRPAAAEIDGVANDRTA